MRGLKPPQAAYRLPTAEAPTCWSNQALGCALGLAPRPVADVRTRPLFEAYVAQIASYLAFL